MTAGETVGGDKYGTVIKVTKHYVHVLMDRSGKVRKLTAANVTAIARRVCEDEDSLPE